MKLINQLENPSTNSKGGYVFDYNNVEKELRKEIKKRPLDKIDKRLLEIIHGSGISGVEGQDQKSTRSGMQKQIRTPTLKPSEKSKSESQMVMRPYKTFKDDRKLIVKANVKATVNQMSSDDDLIDDIRNGLNQSKMAKKYGVSRQSISQRIKKLKRHGTIEKIDGKLNVKEIVKDLALSTTPSKKIYEFQTIQILIPLKNPGQLDLLDWDQYEPVMDQWYKKYPHLKFTLNKTSQSIRLWLKNRWVERPEQIKEICHNYVDMIAEKLKEFDIELLKNQARTTGLHLWKHDKIIEKGYKKEDGFIGVYHGVEADKIFPSDRGIERKTWCDSTPSPDGIESSDSEYFVDKEAMEHIIGEPDLTKPLERPKEELPKYMKKATDFIIAMESISTTFLGLDNRLNVYDKNLEKHIELVDTIKDQSIHQTAFMKDVRDMVKEVTDVSKSLKTELSIIRVEKSMSEPEKEPDKEHGDVACPLCGSSFSKKYLLEHDFKCPNSMCKSHMSKDSNLRWYFPNI